MGTQRTETVLLSILYTESPAQLLRLTRALKCSTFQIANNKDVNQNMWMRQAGLQLCFSNIKSRLSHSLGSYGRHHEKTCFGGFCNRLDPNQPAQLHKLVRNLNLCIKQAYLSYFLKSQ